MPYVAVTFLAFKKLGAILGPTYMWGQRLKVRSSFTVVNFHDFWSNCPRSIWQVIGLDGMRSGGGQPGAKSKFNRAVEKTFLRNL